MTAAIVITSIASERPLRVALAPDGRPEVTAHARARGSGTRERAARMLGRLEDAVLLLLLALAFPLIILVIGLPIALVVRLAVAIASRC